MLAAVDNDATFRAILDQANRGNVSFYPIDPRGLVVFDTPLGTMRTGIRPAGEPTIVPLAVDSAQLRARQDSLRTLAAATDGMAFTSSNDLDAGLKRITDDLSSYYLLGYYSTGRLDGKFHEIRVRARRPGVQVRARRGYLAATAAEVARAGAVAGSRSPAALLPATAAVASAVATLAAIARDVPLRLSVAGGWVGEQAATFWVVGDLDAATAKAGAEVDVSLATASGDTVTTGRAQLPVGRRTFMIALSKAGSIASGDYVARVRVRPADPGQGPLTEIVRTTLPASPAPGDALVYRRGPATANRDVPTADRRFRRNERLRVEHPAPAAQPVVARLLDRTGREMPVPVTATLRTDPDGSRWRSAELALVPLGPGDYVLELSGDGSVSLVAFRVVP
jgi:hypothetical protein